MIAVMYVMMLILLSAAVLMAVLMRGVESTVKVFCFGATAMVCGIFAVLLSFCITFMLVLQAM